VEYDLPGLEGLHLELMFVRNWGWTYRGNQSDSFDMYQELSFPVTKKLTVAVGHDNTGDVLKPNGTDSNVELFNPRSSTIYTYLSVDW